MKTDFKFATVYWIATAAVFFVAWLVADYLLPTGDDWAGWRRNLPAAFAYLCGYCYGNWKGEWRCGFRATATAILTCLLFASSAVAAEPTRHSPRLTPIQGGKFDWQCDLPPVDGWQGSNDFCDYKLGLAEMTFVLFDENGKEIARCLELQYRPVYVKFKPENPGQIFRVIAGIGPQPQCKWFQRAAENAERRCVERHGSGYTHFERPCDTYIEIHIQDGIPSA